MHRTHTCGELTAQHIGQEVTLSWWVANRRDHGGTIFIDLRDRYGITQMVFDPQDNKTAWEMADTFRSEYVVKLTGKVRPRPEGQANPNLVTGEIEIITLSAEILAESKTPPFEISDHTTAHEEIRFKHRYLDLRRAKVLENVKFRAVMNHFTRNWFTDKGFIEVQTPIFTVSSPEGARDFLIPSRLHEGKFYALPQAPQQYKQLLMVGGIDKYFQIAPCFRDEDPRADRHSCEFYQIDCEMSFVEQEDVFQVAEAFVKDLIAAVSPEKHIRENKIYRFTHKQAKDLYGSDKPDVRFDLHFEDFTGDFAHSGFSVFQSAVATGGVVKAMKLEGVNMSRSEIDAITAVAQSNGAKGLAYIIYEAETPETGDLQTQTSASSLTVESPTARSGAQSSSESHPVWGVSQKAVPRSPILKFFSSDEMKALEEKLQPQAGDMIFFGAGEYGLVTKVLGAVRLALRDKYTLADKNELAFAWVTDFPIFEQKDDGTIDFEHNPFSMPHGGVAAFDNPNPTEIYGMQYDLACNGYEILSGSIRNHDIKALVRAFEMVGKGEEEVKEKFGAMYNAFQYGVPPHGGFAFGFDRLLMILKDEDNIREVYAFPKSGKAEDAMMNAPSRVDEVQLKELGIEVRGE